jgi:hypothetical protein
MDKHVRRLIIGLSLPVAATFLIEQLPKKGIVKVPFAFQVQDQTLPPGRYSVQRLASRGGIWIQNQTAPAAAMQLVASGRKWGKADGAKLVFRCYGGRYFLSEIWFSADSAGLVVTPSRLETELASTQPEREVASIHFE